jgi:hypothetical protein
LPQRLCCNRRYRISSSTNSLAAGIDQVCTFAQNLEPPALPTITAAACEEASYGAQHQIGAGSSGHYDDRCN